jgi:hypothetical protein
MLIVSCYQVGFTSFGICKSLSGCTPRILCEGLLELSKAFSSLACLSTFLDQCLRNLIRKCTLLCSTRSLYWLTRRQGLGERLLGHRGLNCHHRLQRATWASPL